ncbi:MAG: hypothetical protein ACHQAZ_09830 [Gammaproteobacteria bacterium]
MHASLEQLISLRDEETVALEVQEHVRGCEQCARALNELAAVPESLTHLTDPLPPPDAWARITATERKRHLSRRWLPAAGVGLAASLAGAVVLFNPGLRMFKAAEAPQTTVTGTVGSAAPADIGVLQAQSQYLERAVMDLTGNTEGMPVSADTATTVAALEDRIALVDYVIGSTSARDKNSPNLAQLWKQRVDLLQSLAAVRYALVADRGI